MPIWQSRLLVSGSGHGLCVGPRLSDSGGGKVGHRLEIDTQDASVLALGQVGRMSVPESKKVFRSMGILPTDVNTDHRILFCAEILAHRRTPISTFRR
jgi:hypothetical protein